MATCVGMQLSARKQPYDDQANFTISKLPFALKIFWAPIVDALYFRRLGRRKTWFQVFI